MQALSFTEWSQLLAAVFLIFPTILLAKQYYRTKMSDYLIFTAFFIGSGITQLSSFIAGRINLLLFFQLNHLSGHFVTFLLFLHLIRILWIRAPSIVWVIGTGWFLILTLLITFWTIMPQPERAFVLFWEMPRSYSSYFPSGAGITTTDGEILSSTAFNIWGLLYIFFTLILLVATYFWVKPAHISGKTILARRLWITIWIMLLSYVLLRFPWFVTSDLPSLDILLLIPIILTLYIALRLPEGMLIFHAQLYRVGELYRKIGVMNRQDAIEALGMEALVDYLQSIPPEMMTQLESIKR